MSHPRLLVLESYFGLQVYAQAGTCVLKKDFFQPGTKQPTLKHITEIIFVHFFTLTNEELNHILHLAKTGYAIRFLFILGQRPHLEGLMKRIEALAENFDVQIAFEPLPSHIQAHSLVAHCVLEEASYMAQHYLLHLKNLQTAFVYPKNNDYMHVFEHVFKRHKINFYYPCGKSILKNKQVHLLLKWLKARDTYLFESDILFFSHHPDLIQKDFILDTSQKNLDAFLKDTLSFIKACIKNSEDLCEVIHQLNLPKDNPSLSFREWIFWLENQLKNFSLIEPPPTTHSTIYMLPLEEAGLGFFDAVWIGQCSEQTWPTTGLERDTEVNLGLWALSKASQAAFLSRSNYDLKGQKTSPHALFQWVKTDSLPQPPTNWIEPAAPASPNPGFSFASKPFQAVFGKHLGLLPQHPLSVRRLEHMAGCSMKSFLRDFLQLHSPFRSKQTDLMALGTLAHGILKAFYEQPNQTLDTVFAAQIEKIPVTWASHPVLKKALEGWLLKTLKQLVYEDQGTPEACELPLTGYFKQDDFHVYLSGIMDRLDQTPKALSVIDYKLSSLSVLENKIREENFLDTEFQLAVYLYLFNKMYPEKSQKDWYAYFVSIKDAKRTPILGLEKMKDLKERIQTQLETKVKALLEPIQKGHIPLRVGEHCKHCEMRRVCRVCL